MFYGGIEWAAMTSFLRQGINVHGKEKVNGNVLVRTMWRFGQILQFHEEKYLWDFSLCNDQKHGCYRDIMTFISICFIGLCESEIF